jgi:anti-sigma-K factor RskA
MNDELDMLAAEYVLGTLEPAERAGFETRMATEEGAKRAVDEWTRRLSPLAGVIEATEPPAGLWNRIETELQPRNPLNAQPAAPPHPANDNPGGDLRRSVAGWRRAFIGASALAALLAAVLVYRELPGSSLQGRSYIAIVKSDGDRPALIVNVDPATKSAYVIPVFAEAPAGRSLELWFIGAGEKPRSLGLVKSQPKRMTLPAGAKIQNALLAVSLEPEGGSATGAPTGPVIYSGQLIEG